MTKKQAMRWVRALRSGKYKQGFGQLADSDGNYCCLGVLAKLNGARPIHLNLLSVIADRPRRGDGHPTSFDCGLKFGDASAAGICFTIKGEPTQFYNLACVNDAGISFKRIATWIEKNYKKL